MKKITKVEVQKNNPDRLNIYLDDSFAFGADIGVAARYGLLKGKELEEEFIEEVLMAEERQQALNCGLTMLSGRARTEAEVRSRLKEKGYDEEVSEDAILRLKSYGYIDDEDYSERFIRDKMNLSKDGRMKIKQALYSKGVDRHIIEEKLKEVSDEDEFIRALDIARRKERSIKETDSFKKKRKLYGYLLGRGFDYDVASRASARVVSVDDDTY